MLSIESFFRTNQRDSESHKPAIQNLGIPTIGKLIAHLNETPNETGIPFKVQTLDGEVTVDHSHRVVIPVINVGGCKPILKQ
jgi:hypothetical protein